MLSNIEIFTYILLSNNLLQQSCPLHHVKLKASILQGSPALSDFWLVFKHHLMYYLNFTSNYHVF